MIASGSLAFAASAIRCSSALISASSLRQLLQEGASFGHGLIGMIDREHHAVDAAKFQKQGEKSRREKEAGKGVVDVFAQIGGDRPL